MTDSASILNSNIKSNFLIVFETDLIPNIEYYVKNVPLTGYNISTNTVASTSSQPIEYYGGILTFKNDISFDVILDEQYQTRQNIDQYMFNLRNQTNGILNQHSFNISLYILSNKGNKISQIRYYNFLMKDIGDLNHETYSDGYSTFNISGSIRYYEWIK
jgi:hypothetical protein